MKSWSIFEVKFYFVYYQHAVWIVFIVNLGLLLQKCYSSSGSSLEDLVSKYWDSYAISFQKLRRDIVEDGRKMSPKPLTKCQWFKTMRNESEIFCKNWWYEMIYQTNSKTLDFFSQICKTPRKYNMIQISKFDIGFIW